MHPISHYAIRSISDDCAGLLYLRRQWCPGNDPDYESAFRSWWRTERPHRRALVAYTAGQLPVGMANGQMFSRMPRPDRAPSRWLYIANVYVVPDHRRRGVARGRMTALIAMARTERMAGVVLAPSPMAQPLYRSLGFRPADDLMRLDLADR